MLAAVSEAIEGVKRAFPESSVTVRDDGSGGAYVLVESVELTGKFTPATTWMGGHIPPQYPFADIYPVFIGADVRLANGTAFSAPITLNHSFCGRQAIQISRRTNRLEPRQTAACKFQKVLYWLTQVP